MLNLQQAQQALQARTAITAEQVEALLGLKSVTFAGITYVTDVATAAAHKAKSIKKVTKANVQLFSNIKAATQVFANAVKRSAGVADFQQQDNYYQHLACYSLVEHKTNGKLYLYAIFNSADSLYFIDNKLASKPQVAQYLTPSAASKLLNPSDVVYNKANDVEHDVQVRTIALANIVSITANKHVLG